MDKATIENIYKELVLLDPSIKNQEKEVKHLIHNLLAIKPESPFSETYKENFKQNLLALVQEQQSGQKNKSSLFSQLRLRIGGFATLSVFVFLILYYQQINEFNKPTTQLITTTTETKPSTEQITPESKIETKKQVLLRAKSSTKEADIPRVDAQQDTSSSTPNEETTTAGSLPMMSFAKQAQDTENMDILQTTELETQTLRTKETNTLPSDKELITTIESLIGSKIDLSQYGDPIIKKDATQTAYMVIYPKTENNEIVYDTNGNISGIWINITPANSMINRIKSEGTLIYDGTKDLWK